VRAQDRRRLGYREVARRRFVDEQGGTLALVVETNNLFWQVFATCRRPGAAETALPWTRRCDSEAEAEKYVRARAAEAREAGWVEA
jgi:hypothetical protein